ncbi:MAG: MBL fold metallo-hydrolase, partial [Anaerolineae bacterium]
IRFLGTGAAEGIPAMGCVCAHCTRARQEGGKLLRERSAILLQLPGYDMLVEAPPDIRGLINKYQVSNLHGIVATHAAYGHIGGIKEFEYWTTPLDFLAEPALFEVIRREHWTPALDELMFHVPYYPGAALYFGQFSLIPFAARWRKPIFGLSIKVGEKRVVYTSSMPGRMTNYAGCLMAGADVLIVNAPTFQPPKEDHITVVEAIELKEQVSAEQLILTYINHHNRPHDELEDYAGQFPGVAVAYDGLSLEI